MAEFNKGALLQKTEEYMDYIKTHKDNVQKAWEELRAATVGIGIINRPNILEQMSYRIRRHDDSKYSEREFLPYRRHFYPMDGEVDDTAQYDAAWQHHYNRNDHHWQYWIDCDGDFIGYADMDERMCACLEMICDWQAMGKSRCARWGFT